MVFVNEECSKIACGSDDSTISIWDLNLNVEIKILQSHTDAVCSLIKLSNG